MNIDCNVKYGRRLNGKIMHFRILVLLVNWFIFEKNIDSMYNIYR